MYHPSQKAAQQEREPIKAGHPEGEVQGALEVPQVPHGGEGRKQPGTFQAPLGRSSSSGKWAI